MTPEIARELENHHTRIEGVEERQDSLEKKLDRIYLGVISTLTMAFLSLVGFVFQMVTKGHG